MGKGSAALAEVPKETALAVVSNARAAMAVSDKVDINDNRGKENLDRSALKLPRISIAQKTSKQLEPNAAEYIDDLKQGQMFNTMTSEVYGNGPIEFVVVGERKRAMQFDQDMNVVDFDVPWSDRRCQFTVNDETGKREKPVATRFYEFIILLVETGDLALLSLKSTGVKAAETLEGYLAARKGPSWAGKFNVKSRITTKGSFSFGQYNILPAGPAPDDIIAAAENLYELTKEREIERDLEDDKGAVKDADVPF